MERKIIAICHESSTKYINALRGKSEQLLNPKRVVNTEIQRDEHKQIRPNFNCFGICETWTLQISTVVHLIKFTFV